MKFLAAFFLSTFVLFFPFPTHGKCTRLDAIRGTEKVAFKSREKTSTLAEAYTCKGPNQGLDASGSKICVDLLFPTGFGAAQGISLTINENGEPTGEYSDITWEMLQKDLSRNPKSQRKIPAFLDGKPEGTGVRPWWWEDEKKPDSGDRFVPAPESYWTRMPDKLRTVEKYKRRLTLAAGAYVERFDASGVKYADNEKILENGGEVFKRFKFTGNDVPAIATLMSLAREADPNVSKKIAASALFKKKGWKERKDRPRSDGNIFAEGGATLRWVGDGLSQIWSALDCRDVPPSWGIELSPMGEPVTSPALAPTVGK